jgi:hypothetical protein
MSSCPICLYNLNSKSIKLDCSHSFCIKCIREWNKQSQTCPICRLVITLSLDHTYNLRCKKHEFCVSIMKQLISEYDNCLTNSR